MRNSCRLLAIGLLLAACRNEPTAPPACAEPVSTIAIATHADNPARDSVSASRAATTRDDGCQAPVENPTAENTGTDTPKQQPFPRPD